MSEMTTMKKKSTTIPPNSNTYTQQDVLDACLEYFGGDELAATTWMYKYAARDRSGSYLELTPVDMHARMAREFARIEKKYRRELPPGKHENLSTYGRLRAELSEQKIFQLLDRFRYIIPQGSVMSSLGNGNQLASLSNCIVLPKIHDSYGGIFYTDQQMAQLFKRRCGVGIDLSSLRPAGVKVNNAAETTSGPVSYMERFSNTTREVSQKGRRGALMITMDIAHPDIEDFITIKQDLSKITGANVSVRISDEFMHAVEGNTTYRQAWPLESKYPSITRMSDAKALWNTIIRCAHTTAEPGIIFWDRQHQYSTSSVYPGFKNLSTNPCGEIAMQGGDSCRLIALNLYGFVEHPFTQEARFDYEKFYETVYEAQRLMDDLVDLELEAIERIIQKVESDPEPDNVKAVELETWKLLAYNGSSGRRTGLGFTALADTLASLNMRYDSDEALRETEHIMHVKCGAEFDSSIDLAIERGAFPGFDPVIENASGFVQMLKSEMPSLYERMMSHGRRNISISTVAPTGTLSILAQSSSGIEPVFMTSYKRRRKLSGRNKNTRVDFIDDSGDMWEEFAVYHPKMLQWMEANPGKDEKNSPYYGSTAGDIDWRKRIQLQSVVQKYTTHSISSTINLKAEVTYEQVAEIYLEAWKAGLKGVTVYRDGSRSGVLVSQKEKEDITDHKAPERPEVLDAEVVRFQNRDQRWIAVVGLMNNRPYEIFTGRIEESLILPGWVNKGWILKKHGENGKARYDFQYLDKDDYRITMEGLSRTFNPEFWNYAKLISGVLRHGMPLPQVVDVVENLNLDSENINTWKSGVARALKKFIRNGTPATDHQCGECGDPEGMVYQEGCLTCKSCGQTKCG